MTLSGRITFAVIALFLVAGVVYYWAPWQPAQQQPGGKGKKGKKGGGGGTDEPVPVLAIDARAADVPIYLDGVGTVKALNTVTVRPQIAGKLISVTYKEGQTVPKDFVLAKIDPTAYQAAYDQAVAKKAQDQAQLDNAKLDLERYAKLAATNAVNKQQVDTQRAQVAQFEALVKFDQAGIDAARANLSYTDIVAPLAGRTGIRLVDEGNLVNAFDTTGIVVITQLQPIAVFFNLPQQELPKLVKGQAEGNLPVDAIGPDGLPSDTGKLVVIDNLVDQTTGTIRLKAEFPNGNFQLWPGQFTNVRLLIESLYQVVVVPTAAVQRNSNTTFVWIVKPDNTVTTRDVEVKYQDDQQAVIGRGLNVGEVVVTSGFPRLKDGAPVTVESAEGSGQVSPPGGKGKGKGKKGKGNQTPTGGP